MMAAKNHGMASLELKLILEPTTVKAGGKIDAQVLLTNWGAEPIVVNSRFSMGYPDTQDRDLYCQIFQENGTEYLGYQAYQVDYKAQELSPKFFPALQPGETIQATFDLHKW